GKTSQKVNTLSKKLTDLIRNFATAYKGLHAVRDASRSTSFTARNRIARSIDGDIGHASNRPNVAASGCSLFSQLVFRIN
ncbi:hypothetical protein, partial [Burkholderia pseudomultivorans]|uniref:hypothetical protein n=1 Tax=Burkholderia pseudomultivorans TaxID=1207504 RepID=UPI001E3CE8D2